MRQSWPPTSTAALTKHSHLRFHPWIPSTSELAHLFVPVADPAAIRAIIQ